MQHKEEEPMRQRGSGGLIQLRRKDGKLASPYWCMLYWVNGRQIRESSKTASKMVAEALLRKWLSERDAGQKPAVDIAKVTYENLRDALLQEYEINGCKSLVRRVDGGPPYLPSVLPLDRFFAGRKVNGITADAIRKFVLEQQKAGKTNATINRSLAAVSRMFQLAVRDGKLQRQNAPNIEFLKEAAPRKGFLELADFRRLRQELPEHLRALATLGFYTGMRKGEILKLNWGNVNLADSTLRLHAGETKNDGARTIPLTGEVLEMLRILRQQNPNSKLVFAHNGQPIRHFEKSWKSACVRAGMPGLLFHDLRRTGVRNLIRAGVPERVAMSISGHKTRTIFDRYNIVSERDLHDASRKLENYLSEREADDTTTVKLGTTTDQ